MMDTRSEFGVESSELRVGSSESGVVSGWSDSIRIVKALSGYLLILLLCAAASCEGRCSFK